MRATFRTNAERLSTEGYRFRPDALHSDARVTVVFGGEHLVLYYVSGGSYRSGGVQQYMKSHIALRPRDFGDQEVREALNRIRHEHDEHLDPLFNGPLPTSPRKEQDILDMCAEVDQKVSAQVRRHAAVLENLPAGPGRAHSTF